MDNLWFGGPGVAGEGEVCSAVLLNEDKKPEFNSIPSNQEYLKNH